MHARWVLYLQKFTFVFRHKARFQNTVSDALSRRAHLLTVLCTEIIGFDVFPAQYIDDEDFTEIWHKYTSDTPVADFHIHQGYLFKGNLLCVPWSSLREHIIRELHANGLAAHFIRPFLLA